MLYVAANLHAALLALTECSGTGPIPVISGETPETARAAIFALGVNPYGQRSNMINKAEAPSLRPLEPSAVTLIKQKPCQLHFLQKQRLFKAFRNI